LVQVEQHKHILELLLEVPEVVLVKQQLLAAVATLQTLAVLKTVHAAAVVMALTRKPAAQVF
jgi:hypothetical protein